MFEGQKQTLNLWKPYPLQYSVNEFEAKTDTACCGVLSPVLVADAVAALSFKQSSPQVLWKFINISIFFFQNTFSPAVLFHLRLVLLLSCILFSSLLRPLFLRQKEASVVRNSVDQVPATFATSTNIILFLNTSTCIASPSNQPSPASTLKNCRRTRKHIVSTPVKPTSSRPYRRLRSQLPIWATPCTLLQHCWL